MMLVSALMHHLLSLDLPFSLSTSHFSYLILFLLTSLLFFLVQR
jgi:hypothetical protein